MTSLYGLLLDIMEGQFVKQKLGSNSYSGLSENVLLSFGNGQSPLDRTFQQDNARVQVPNQTENFFDVEKHRYFGMANYKS